MSKSILKEIALAEVVIKYLEENGWDVYQEVKFLGKIADIVAIKKFITWAIECKVGSPYYAMDQALEWVNWSHFVSIAIPANRRGKRGRLLYLMKDFTGIGVLEVNTNVREVYGPKLNRNIWRHGSHTLKDFLHDGHKSFARAGSKNEPRWSPWQHTCSKLREYVKNNSGCRIGEAVKNIPHHYHDDTNAKAALMNWIRQGKIEGIKRVKEGKAIKLFPIFEKEGGSE